MTHKYNGSVRHVLLFQNDLRKAAPDTAVPPKKHLVTQPYPSMRTYLGRSAKKLQLNAVDRGLMELGEIGEEMKVRSLDLVFSADRFPYFPIKRAFRMGDERATNSGITSRSWEMHMS